MSVPAPSSSDALTKSAESRTAIRRSGEITIQPFVVPGTILFAPVLIRAPILFGQSPPLWAYALSLLPFCAAIVSLSLWRARWYACTSVLLAVAYVALVVIAAFRGSYFETISGHGAALEAVQFTLLALLAGFAFLREPREHQRGRYIRALCWSPVVYVSTNVVLHFGGVAATGATYRTQDQELAASTLQLLGVSASRVLFPLAPGVNAFGPICAIALAICATLWLRREQRKLATLGALVSIYAILAIDSRGALMFGVLSIALVTLIPRARHRGLGWVAIALPLLPILLVTTLGALSSSTTAGLSRTGPGAESIATGSGRTIVWQEAAKVLSKPSIDSLLGYGQNGQVTSGASLWYAYLFVGQVEPLKANAHNMVLQTGLDLGWIGIVCAIALAAAVLTRLSLHALDPLYLALMTGCVAVLLIGVVEAAPTPANPESFAFWLLAVFAALGASRRPA